jgi:hypothetical protein
MNGDAREAAARFPEMAIRFGPSGALARTNAEPTSVFINEFDASRLKSSTDHAFKAPRAPNPRCVPRPLFNDTELGENGMNGLHA